MDLERSLGSPFAEALPDTEGKNITIGARLLLLREQYGISQGLLASETGTSQGYISQIENDGVQNIGYVKVINLARALGTGIGFLENGASDSKVFMTLQARKVENFMNSEAPENLKSALRQYLETLPDLPPSNPNYIDYFPTQQKLKDKLKTRRNQLGITQWKLALDSGLSQGYLSQLEGSTKEPVEEPSISVILKLVEALDLNIYDLLDLKEITPPDWLIKVDTFFKSERVPLETKKRAWQIISLMMDQARDQFFYAPQSYPGVLL